jgi:ribonuclease PH
VTNNQTIPNISSVVNVKQSLSPRSRRSRVSGWLPVEQEAKLAQRFFDVAADSSVPWKTFPNSILIVSYRNGFVVLDADGQELFRKITGESLAV